MAGGGWKLTRHRGSLTAQLPLALCGVLAVVIALLGRAEASIFDQARARLSDWSAPTLTAMQAPVAAMQRWTGAIPALFTIYDENLRLRAEIEELRRWQDTALTLEQRLKRYELLLNAVPDPELPSLTARVIGQATRPFVKTMILGAGSARAVRRGQAVLDDRGLVGRIYVTGEQTSWVILLTDLNSRIPVVIRPSNRRAILAGDNTSAPVLELDAGAAPVNAGDRVYTTGDGGVLPPYLPVGVAIRGGAEWRVSLFADPDLSDYVQVVDYRPAAEPPPASATEELPMAPAEADEAGPGVAVREAGNL